MGQPWINTTGLPPPPLSSMCKGTASAFAGSALPEFAVVMRDQICAGVSIDAAELPYVAELFDLQVRAVEPAVVERGLVMDMAEDCTQRRSLPCGKFFGTYRPFMPSRHEFSPLSGNHVSGTLCEC